MSDDELVAIVPEKTFTDLVSTKTIFRPDTAYLFARLLWRGKVAEKINDAIASVSTPGGRSILARIDALMECVDPFEEARLRKLPWHELLEELKARDKEILGFTGIIPMAAVEIAGRHFKVLPWSPRRGCNFQLQGNCHTIHARIGSPKHNSPNIYLEIGSLPFWEEENWKNVFLNWQSWLNELGQTKVDWQFSRLDLAFHTQLLTVDDLDRSKFVCRGDVRQRYTKEQILDDLEKANAADKYARLNNMDVPSCVDALIEKWHKEVGFLHCDWFKGEVPQMITHGKRGWLHNRIYNKSKEICGNPVKFALFHEIWKQAGFSPKQDVLNVEFEIPRAWFHSRELVVDGQHLVIDTIHDLLTHYEKLCAYLLGSKAQGGWLRMIDRTNSRVERCPTSEAWKLIREATDLLPLVSTLERKHQLYRSTAGRLIPQAVRWKSQADAMLGRPVDPDNISLHAIFDCMAELIANELNREDHLSWSDYAIKQAYLAERSKLEHIPSLASAS